MRIYIALLIVALMAGCTQPSPDLQKNTDFVGEWRILSNTRYIGNESYYSAPTERLELKPDGSWSFGSSSGSWEVASIEKSDWQEWKIENYGPTRKIILNNWESRTWSGPIEENDGQIDFLWVIYDVDIGNGLQQMQLKFGRNFS